MTLAHIWTRGTARHQGEQYERKPHRFQLRRSSHLDRPMFGNNPGTGHAATVGNRETDRHRRADSLAHRRNIRDREEPIRMPPKLVVRRECTPDRCQTASRLSAASDVMSIRRTDKHCGARLVAAPASPLPRPFRPPSRLCAATLPSNLLSPSLSRPFLPPLSLSLSPISMHPIQTYAALHHHHRHHHHPDTRRFCSRTR